MFEIGVDPPRLAQDFSPLFIYQKGEKAMNKLTQIWINNSEVTREYIPCQICGEPTTMLGTRLCNGCWEVMGRLLSFCQCANAIQFVRDILVTVEKGTSS